MKNSITRRLSLILKILAIFLILVISLTASDDSGCNCGTEGQSGTQTWNQDKTESGQPIPNIAFFEIISLNVDKTEVIVGQSVKISAVCKNTGNAWGSQPVFFYDYRLDPAMIHQEQVALDVGESKQVDYTYETNGTTPLGGHQLSVGAKNVTFKVIINP